MTSGATKHLKLGWFTTGRGEGSYGLLKSALDAIDSGRLDGEIEFVFINRARGQTPATDRLLDMVESRGIPLVALSSRDFRRRHGNRPWSELREEFDRAVIELLASYSPDIAVQAGYMLIAPLLCQEFTTINLHPALPGGTIGMWQAAVWDTIESRSREAGAMVHISTVDVDEGPVLSICRFPVRGPGFDELWRQAESEDIPRLRAEKREDLPLFQAIRQAGLLRERPLLVETIQAIADGRIRLEDADANLPLDLTREVEEAVAVKAASG